MPEAGARLLIEEASYVLSLRDGVATLSGGANAVLPSGRPVDAGSVELAIERIEDWLMPHAAALAGSELEVIDATGRLAAGLGEVLSVTDREWTAEQLEPLFERIAHMSSIPRLAAKLEGRHGFVASLTLLRELAHHGKLKRVSLRA